MVQLYRILALSLSLVYTALAACNYGTTEFPREPNVPIGTFGYTGLDGPLNWYSLNKSANILCAEGHFQSPINLNSSIRVAPGNRGLTFNITSYPEGAELENLGTTLEVPANGTFTIADNTYNLAQFHFHTPTEHRIDLEHYPMELHFVFQAADKSIAVVAFVIRLGPADPLLKSVFENAVEAATPGEATRTGPLVFTDLEGHFSSNNVFEYSGSLTTPPCSENVLWHVSAEPLTVDQDTYIKVKRIMKFNSRYTRNVLGGTNLLENSANARNP
ncbi:unnamed protein product [Clonostachys chloroleuca]|uniref:carbonic anhydrase n=1 Tax=Clonostachys chloroleuca TaxID=1926264 RepID=A0AA35M796_9HYPO|nr:unnamed protein product [Clonostachys chloroleuca]